MEPKLPEMTPDPEREREEEYSGPRTGLTFTKFSPPSPLLLWLLSFNKFYISLVKRYEVIFTINYQLSTIKYTSPINNILTTVLYTINCQLSTVNWAWRDFRARKQEIINHYSGHVICNVGTRKYTIISILIWRHNKEKNNKQRKLTEIFRSTSTLMAYILWLYLTWQKGLIRIMGQTFRYLTLTWTQYSYSRNAEILLKWTKNKQ